MTLFAANISLLFAELPFLERIAAAAAAGFAAVECQFPYDQDPAAIGAALAAAGVAMVLVNSPAGGFAAGERGFAALAGRESAFRGSIEQALALALATGAPRVHVVAGAGEADLAVFADNLAWAAERFAPHAITALVEPLNPRDNPGYALARFEVAAEAIARAGAANVALQFDIYHWLRSGLGDPADYAPLIGHVQIAAEADRGEPGPRELALLGQLFALGYRGAVGCEYVPRGGTVAGLGWLEAARALAPAD